MVIGAWPLSLDEPLSGVGQWDSVPGVAQAGDDPVAAVVQAGDDPATTVVQTYRVFARREARGRSAAYESQAESVAGDLSWKAYWQR